MTELRVLQSLPKHAHIIALLGCVIDEPSRTYMIVLEWMEQGSLFEYLKAMRESADAASRFPLLARLRMSLQTTRAVNHLHLLNPPLGPIVHRDLKSPNILLNRHGDIKLCDFGLAKLRLTSSTQSTVGSQSAAGTLRWWAPEFLRPGGKKSATPASDVYALGVVLWEILTLQIPYDGDEDETIKDSIKGGPDDKLAIPDELPQPIHLLLHACWTKDPKQRPGCMELVHALKQLIAEEEKLPPSKPSSAASVRAPVTSSASSAAVVRPAAVTQPTPVTVPASSSVSSASGYRLVSFTPATPVAAASVSAVRPASLPQPIPPPAAAQPIRAETAASSVVAAPTFSMKFASTSSSSLLKHMTAPFIHVCEVPHALKPTQWAVCDSELFIKPQSTFNSSTLKTEYSSLIAVHAVSDTFVTMREPDRLITAGGVISDFAVGDGKVVVRYRHKAMIGSDEDKIRAYDVHSGKKTEGQITCNEGHYFGCIAVQDGRVYCAGRKAVNIYDSVELKLLGE